MRLHMHFQRDGEFVAQHGAARALFFTEAQEEGQRIARLTLPRAQRDRASEQLRKLFPAVSAYSVKRSTKLDGYLCMCALMGIAFS